MMVIHGHGVLMHRKVALLTMARVGRRYERAKVPLKRLFPRPSPLCSRLPSPLSSQDSWRLLPGSAESSEPLCSSSPGPAAVTRRALQRTRKSEGRESPASLNISQDQLSVNHDIRRAVRFLRITDRRVCKLGPPRITAFVVGLLKYHVLFMSTPDQGRETALSFNRESFKN